LAVVKIVIAGVKYMFSDIVTQKSEAKKDIQGAIFGLILILGAVLILTVINPDLTNFNLEQSRIALPPAPAAEEVATRNTCLEASRTCTYLTCSNGCTEEIDDCRQLGNLPIQNGQNNLACVGNVVGALEDIPFMSGENFVADIRDCRASNNEFKLYFQSNSQYTSVCCSGQSCPASQPIEIGSVNFGQETIYSMEEMFSFLELIENENEGAVITPITGVTNDTDRIADIQDRINRCFGNNYTPHQLYWTDDTMVNVEIICIPNQFSTPFTGVS